VPGIGYCLATMTGDEPLAERAVALAGEAGAGSRTTDEVVKELTSSGDRDALELARTELVARIHLRSDDYAATGALNLVNRALAAVGWADPYNWKHRRKP
jgi:hypothetical protein